MDQEHTEDYADWPEQARALLLQQRREIEALQRQVEREQFARELRQILSSMEAVSAILAPFSYEHLLEMLVQTAADVIYAQSGSLFLLDEEANELLFQVAIGPAAQEVKKFRVPVGHGIVGITVLTGQPMAIGQAEQSQHVALDIASAVNYIPESILCVPLFYDGKIIGALELLNKTGAGAFTPKDMEVLGLFANIAALAIAQSQVYHKQSSLLQTMLASFSNLSPAYREKLTGQAARFASWMAEEDVVSMKTRKLALLVHELTLLGDQGIDLSTTILQSIVLSARSRGGSPALSGLY